MKIRDYKKNYLLCKDDFGKNIYAGDTVEIFIPMTFSTPFTSLVYWDRLHGAMIKIRPIFLDKQETFEHLYEYLNQSPFQFWRGDNLVVKQGYIKKVKSFNK